MGYMTIAEAGTVTITSKNMIVLPKRAREEFHLEEGQKLKVFIQDDEIILSPLLSLPHLVGILRGPRTSRELIAESRKKVSRFD